MARVVSAGRLLVRLRYLVLSGALAAWFTVVYPRGTGRDWWVFQYAGRIIAGTAGPRFDDLSNGPLHLYTDMPKLQVGPPALLTATPAVLLGSGVGRLVAAIAMTAALVPLVALLERTARLASLEAGRSRVVALVGGLLAIPAWTSVSLVYMHVDDVLALGLVVVAMHELVSGRPWTLALALGVGAASKPWAIAFLALLGALPRRFVAPALLLAMATISLWWLPFVLAEPGTIGAVGNAGNGIASDSTIGLFVTTDPAGWARELQLVLMLATAVLLVRRGRWTAMVVLVVAVRIATDWQTWGYYGAGLLLGALAWDILGHRHRVPWATGLALAAALVPPWIAGTSPGLSAPTAAALARLVLLAALAALVLRWGHDDGGLLPPDVAEPIGSGRGRDDAFDLAPVGGIAGPRHGEP